MLNPNLPQSSIRFEKVLKCPMCHSVSRSIAVTNVKDWTFGCVPGAWSYYRCSDCDSIYLGERPTEETIANAYINYYTHSDDSKKRISVILLIALAAKLLKQGYLNYSLGADCSPAISLPTFLYKWMEKKYLLPRIFLQDLFPCRPGNMLDIGCGDGKFMTIAEAYGWETVGIDLDLNAVKAATAKGLKVLNASYQQINEGNQKYDLIICSHVLEHVHNPLDFLAQCLGALAPNGQIWLQWPNPSSSGIYKFRQFWRGFEAPRHLCLPSIRSVRNFVMSKIDNSIICRDMSEHWQWGQIVMNESSKQIQAISGKSRYRCNYIGSAIKYIFASKHGSLYELNTLCLRKP